MDRKVVERFHHAAIRLLRALRAVDEAGGFSGPRASALSVLVFRGPQSLAGLAAAEGVKPPTMSRLVKAMQADGLLEATSQAHDLRQIRIAASERGKRALLKARERRLRALEDMLRDASPAEIQAMEKVVELLTRSFERRTENPEAP
jgi:DNA-binding MarR family transcriptional regulator